VRPDELLLIDLPEFSGRLREVHSRMRDSQAFRQLVIRNPVGAINEVIFRDEAQPPITQVNKANRLLFSLLSNEGFMAWAQEYQEQVAAGGQQQEALAAEQDLDLETLLVNVDLDKMYSDLAQAAVDFVDVELLYSLIAEDPDRPADSPRGPLHGRRLLEPRRPAEPGTAPQLAPVLIFGVAVAVIVAVVVAIEFWGMAPEPDQLSRADLQRVANMLVGELTERAAELRGAGLLTSPEALRRGLSL